MDGILDQTIADASKFLEAKKVIDDHLTDLLQRRYQVSTLIDRITHEMIDDKKDEIEHLESEIEGLMQKLNLTDFKSANMSVASSISMIPKIIDETKFREFAKIHPQILKKETPIKLGELNKLIDEGVIPTSEEHGLDISQTITKFSYRKR